MHIGAFSLSLLAILKSVRQYETFEMKQTTLYIYILYIYLSYMYYIYICIYIILLLLHNSNIK